MLLACSWPAPALLMDGRKCLFIQDYPDTFVIIIIIITIIIIIIAAT